MGAIYVKERSEKKFLEDQIVSTNLEMDLRSRSSKNLVDPVVPKLLGETLFFFVNDFVAYPEGMDNFEEILLDLYYSYICSFDYKIMKIIKINLQIQ